MERPGYRRSQTWSPDGGRTASRAYGTAGQSAAKMAFHLTIDQWLQALELEMYLPKFEQYQTVENLLHLSERHLSELGVSNSAHRARLASNLVYIREKVKRSSIAGSPLKCSLNYPRQRTSIAGSPYSSPVASPSAKNSFRYSTIPEGLTPVVPLSPKLIKMDLCDTSPEELKKELEAELKLPNDDLRSHAWFHGGIGRDKVEKLLMGSGDFLVRDSISQPGNYVLSLHWHNSPMHFVINRVVLQADTPYASIQYQLEQESFDSVPSLIRFHIGNVRPVSQTSGAVIRQPVNRSIPLSYIDSKYAAINRSQVNSCTYGVLPRRVVTPRLTLSHQENFRQRSGSQPTLLSPTTLENASMRGRSESSPDIIRPTNGLGDLPQEEPEHVPLGRTESEPIIDSPTSPDIDYAQPTAGSGVETPRMAPALPPLRTKPSAEDCTQTNGINDVVIDGKTLVDDDSFQAPRMYITDHLYSEIEQYDCLPIRYAKLQDKSDPKPDGKVEAIDDEIEENDVKMQKRRSDTRNSLLDADYSKMGEPEQESVDMTPEKLVTDAPLPSTDEPSCLKLSEFTTALLGEENKPLEGAVLADAKLRILNADPCVLAQHLTKIDYEMCRITDTSRTLSGMEQLTLPQGTVMRNDLLERYNCLKTWCAVCILTCAEQEQRILMIHQWTQVAEALRASLGNLFSFTAVMDGLGCKQVMQLKQSWDMLRSSHTTSAVNYETKLRSLLKSLNTGENTIPPTRTSVPHIVPLMQLLERDWTTLTATDWSQPATSDTLGSLPRGESWEESNAGFGLDALLNHLQNAHSFADQANLYRMNANSKLDKFLADKDLLDVCRTEFHLKMLWGSKGCTAGATERYDKFAKVLGVMASKVEPAGV